MTNTRDLYIREHIVPLFDYTFNQMSKNVLEKWFEIPATTLDQIEYRQLILKGFISNKALFDTFSYSATDFYDTYQIVFHPDLHIYRSRDIVRYYSSGTFRNRILGDLIHVCTFFYHLKHKLLDDIDIQAFPTSYQKELVFLCQFLDAFNLSTFMKSIGKGRFGLRQVMSFIELLVKRQKNKQTERFFNALQQFEVYMSLAIGIHKNGFVFPKVGGRQLNVQQAYHPYIESPVAANFYTEKQVILITGANMSGKSTLLKTVSLCVFLAHLGLAIPAKSAIIPFFNHFSIMIDHNDDLASGYSHFMMEIKRLKEVVLHAQKGEACFAIFDELFKGTNMEDAAQISKITIQGLMGFQTSLFFITTHIHELKEAVEVQRHEVETWYLDCDVQQDVPRFTYQLKKGWSDLKIGQILFRLEGLTKMLLTKPQDPFNRTNLVD